MAKDKKKKKKGKKVGDGKSTGALSGKVTKRLQEISDNPLVANVVAATLIGAASALRDSKKAQQLAANAEDELEELAQRGAKTGSALWQLALDVGRKALDALAEDGGKSRPKKASSKTVAAPKSRKSTAKSVRTPAKRPSAKPSAG